MRTWTLRTSRRHSRTRSSCWRKRTQAAGSCLSAFRGAEHYDHQGVVSGQSSTAVRGLHVRQTLQGPVLYFSEVEEEDEEDDEDEDIKSVEEFDESVDRFEHSGWRPMRLCTAYYSGGCARGWECTFAHSEQELHPWALP